MVRRTVVTLAAVGLAACEFPTEMPRWEQTWEVPGERITVSVAELLPAGVTISDDGASFVTDAPGTSLQLTLSEMCPTACAPFDGMVAPKPAFGDTITTSTALPADLVSATLSGGSFSATMAHNFNFDPLRPSVDPDNPRGFIVVRITSNGNVVAEDSIDGADRAFPEGTSLTPSLLVQPVTVTDTLDIEIRIFSPAGDNTTIELSDTLGITVDPSTLEIAQATVNAASLTIDGEESTMDFGGVDDALVERVQSGVLVVDVSNPFTVTGSLDMTFTLPFRTIQRSLAIAEGSYQERLEFSGDELRDLLGSETVGVTTSGTIAASGAGGTVTIDPTQVLTLDNDFELVVLIGPTEDL
jgi:hypothetical protein